MTAEELVNTLNEILNQSDAPVYVSVSGVQTPVTSVIEQSDGNGSRIVIRTEQ